jgi:gamma-glutamyl-gamma-aminobutyrate hydrolase PuuD
MPETPPEQATPPAAPEPAAPRDGAPLIVVTVADPAQSDDPALALRKQQLYEDAVARHGGNPVTLHVNTPADEKARLLARMDGLLFTGGAGDIDPELYGETPNGARNVDRPRDAMELEAWRAAERRWIPVLGICRGHQLINVFSGGSLIQDVPSHAGTPYGHGEAMTHDLDVDPDSRLARAIAEAAPDGFAATESSDTILELAVNSFHHQAVDESRLAPGLRAVAWAHSEAGRLVEGLESREERWVVGVQCHPERPESTPPELDGLWADFIQAVEEARAKRAK